MRRYHDNESTGETPAKDEDNSKRKELHKCNVCPRSFLYAQDRDEHENAKHRGVREHACSNCSKSYSSRKALVVHEKQAHGEDSGKTFACEVSYPGQALLRD